MSGKAMLTIVTSRNVMKTPTDVTSNTCQRRAISPYPPVGGGTGAGAAGPSGPLPPQGRSVLRRALEQSDHVSFRVAELPQLNAGLHLGGAHEPSAAELLGLRQRRLDIGNLDVERQVSRHAFRDTADSAADPDAFEVGLALDDPVAERVVGVHRP